MANKSVLYELQIDLGTKTWGVDCLLDQSLTGPVQYGWDRYQKDPQSMTFGGGLLAGSPLPGTRRMIFCGYSPQWEGFYVSALGGAMYVFHRIGVNYVWLKGEAKEDVAIVINHKDGEYSIKFEPVVSDAIWREYRDENGKSHKGFYAMQMYLVEKYRKEFDEDWFRVLTVGPGARLTNFAGIGSSPIKDRTPTVVDDWAGRGGLGSRLVQHHHVVGIVFGGDWQDPALKEARELDEYFLKHFGQRAITSDLALNEKYRYVAKFETGGTFGVNMHTAGDKLFSMNYQSVNRSKDERLEVQTQRIINHYLKQFNVETIQPRLFAHCGEPCAIACKKYRDEFRKDYEPYAALGPNIGIFDQRAAELVNKYVDSLGLDSIQTGGMVSWLMECFSSGVLDPVDFGLPTPALPFTWLQTGEVTDIAEQSMQYARYAIAIIDMILFSPAGEVFRKGIRFAAKAIDSERLTKTLDLAVYTAHGENGCMVPNQYWTPGMFAPMPMMGKYFSYYGSDFVEPYTLGRKNVERFVYELYSENSGSCRFHRKWVEDIIDEIILSHFDLDFDFWHTNFTLARAIHDHQSSAGVVWESERVVDIIKAFVVNWQAEGLTSEGLSVWVDKFTKDKWAAAREFWQLMYKGMEDAFREGFDEPEHVEHGFIKK